jgi:CheY-like chemotaxis protein
MRILVVDDDVDNACSMGELFELEGHSVMVVHSGEAAIGAWLAEDFDIAFMDVMMPGKNGVESFLEIRRSKPGAKVYMMTGYSVEQLLQQAIAGGALGVLTKPVDSGKLLNALDSVRPAGIVVVAEADPAVSAGLAEIVSSSGRITDLARCADDAFVAAARENLDVLILDLRRPLIESIEIYSSLREAGLAVPTVIVTPEAEDHGDTLKAIGDVAVTGILNKPFDPLQLLERLDKLAA